MKAIEDTGFTPSLPDESTKGTIESLQRKKEIAKWKRQFLWSLIFSIPVFIFGY